MDRRTLLGSLLAPKLPSEETLPKLTDASLTPYQGEFKFEQAIHLLRRTTFGPGKDIINEAVNNGLESTLDILFAETDLPEPPVNYFYEQDPFVPIGSTWINAPYSASLNLQGNRFRSLYAWSFGLMLNETHSIREKLTLFWLNHFGISNVNDPKFLYRHIDTIRKQSWGNFKALVKDITIDPTMLRFLNGRANTFQAPNENYARELLELYTIGKGPQAGPGDYTNYTEEDVKEIARALTGWRDIGYRTLRADVEVGVIYRSNRHDKGEKKLSHRFDERVIPNMEEEEYAHVVDIIFEKEETARFISRKLYRWFVFHEISTEVEEGVIAPMAQILITNNFEIKPALIALLGSEHFFDFTLRGSMIKNPIDFTLNTFRNLDLQSPENLRQQYSLWYVLYVQAGIQQMQYLNPPDVAGWKAFYQEPLYYRTWINATTLPLRMDLTDALTTRGTRVAGYQLLFNPLKWLEKLDNAFSPNDMIREIANLIFPMPIPDNQLDALKEIIIPGLPDFEWNLEYSLYLENPDDRELEAAIDTKLRQLFQAMFAMPEFHLM